IPHSSKPGSIDWYSLLQFGLSVLAVVILWGIALSSVALGLSQRLGGAAQPVDDLQLFLIAAGMAFCGVLLLPSAWYALARIMGRTVENAPVFLQRLRPTLLILAFPLLLGLGYWISQFQAIAWLLLPPIHVLVISLPVLWLAYLGVRDLPTGSPQRASGVFASGLALAPLLILFGEVAAILVGFGIFIVLVAMRPDLAESLNALAERLMAAAPSPEIALRILMPLLESPVVIFMILLFAAVIVPLIEELIKPIGVWLLAGRKLTPTEGFAAGVLSGAGYAMVESLFLGSNSQDWAVLVFARIGTGVMHILTAGLVGWALVNAWTQANKLAGYLRLGAVYLLAVLVHGMWNGLTLTSALTSALSSATGRAQLDESPYIQIGQIANYLLVGLAAAALLALIGINRALARQQHAPGEQV
ncbi:MAG: PrsW family glutamic-type intramembrane protease, partial [Anaerolineales bacterium]